MIPYGFHPEAGAEFLEAVRWYEAQQPGLGRRFRLAVRDTVQRIRAFPMVYREIGEGVRKCRVVRFPYGIAYRGDAEGIVIIAVMHLSRDPGYWKGRIGGA